MGYKILLSKKAKKQLDRIAKKDQKSIVLSIDDLSKIFAEKSSHKSVKKLKIPFLGYRKRVGNYRILFEVLEEDREIKIYKIGHRREVYR